MADSTINQTLEGRDGESLRVFGLACALSKGLNLLGSLKTTLIIIVLLGMGVTWLIYYPAQATRIMVLPFGLLALNLSAAILVHPMFKVRLGLMVFHLALLAIILLIVVGRLTYLKGWVEVTEGAAFNAQLTGYEAGPWHPWHLDEAIFINEAFEINYAAGPRRTHTYNRVGWVEAGELKQALIGDQDPLVMAGYRFYTSFNKGFAPLFSWRPHATGKTITGDLHLPSYPANKNRQTAEWTPPGLDRSLWFLLTFEEQILSPKSASVFHPPKEHRLIVRSGEDRYELKPGDTLTLEQGSLTYHELRTWMGYTVYYDWTRPWLVATCLMAIFGLSWHLWERFFSTPWLRD